MNPSHTKPPLYVEFRGEEILLEQGRLLFSLLKAFSAANHPIRLLDNLPRENLGKYGKLIFSLKHLTLTQTAPENREEWIYLFDRPDKKLAGNNWKKKIQIAYDIFSPYWFRDPIIMPFPPHPAQNTDDLPERLERYRSLEKHIRIFFSGDSKGYMQNRVNYPAPKLPRLEILNTLIERLGNKVLLVQDEKQLRALSGSGYTHQCVLVDTGKIWVDEKEWMPSLAHADFFLSPPGIVMPMCHNLVEAMSVGTIPITNYPEWFIPDLIHMENCLTFEGHDDLIEKIHLALNMSAEEIARLRANALNYYDNHLRAGHFVQQVMSSKESTVTVLLITERNMARNHKQLNRNSVLIRGTGNYRKRTWFERLLKN